MNRNFTLVEKCYSHFTNQFSGYKIIENGITSNVPLDEANTDYQAIQEWIAEGNTVIDNPTKP
jgi:hypothetical protein